MLKRVLSSAVRRSSALGARLSTRDYLVVFNFHQVSPAFEKRFHRHNTWTALPDFERRVRWIRDRFDLVTLAEGIAGLRDRSLHGACAAITLDDGDVCVEQHVTPLLRREGIPATYFINSGYWDGVRAHWCYLFNYFEHHDDEACHNAWRAEFDGRFFDIRDTHDPEQYRALRDRFERLTSLVDAEEQLFVSREFLATLEPELFTVGLHGHEHQRFGMMPESWQRESLEENVRRLGDLPAYRPLFAVPFGRPHDWDETVPRLCRDLGLELVLANDGVNVPGDAPIHRIPSDGADVEQAFRRSWMA